jgi:hypothetical protein
MQQSGLAACGRQVKRLMFLAPPLPRNNSGIGHRILLAALVGIYRRGQPMECGKFRFQKSSIANIKKMLSRGFVIFLMMTFSDKMPWNRW